MALDLIQIYYMVHKQKKHFSQLKYIQHGTIEFQNMIYRRSKTDALMHSNFLQVLYLQQHGRWLCPR